MKRIPYVEAVEDARLRPGVFPVSGKRPIVEMTPDRLNERIYCISCHQPGAFVSADMPGVIYLCDDCATTQGELPLPRLAI